MPRDQIPSSEITPESLYLNRRNFIKAGLATASVALTGLAYRSFNHTGSVAVTTEELPGILPVSPEGLKNGFSVDEPQTPLDRAVNYNNFYEFTTDKQDVAERSRGFVSKPWEVTVDGMVHKPKTFDIDEILKLVPLEERIYRMRCVETWSMVVPWVGIPWVNCSKESNRWAASNLWLSKPCSIRSGCRDRRRKFWTGLTWKAYVWMRQCIL